MLAPTTSEDGAPMKKWGCGLVHFTDEEEDLLFVVGGYGVVLPHPQQHGAQYQRTDNILTTNEQHIFGLSTSEWNSFEVTGQAPSPCSHFTLIKVGEKRAAMYGGWNGSSRLSRLLVVELGRHSLHWSTISIGHLVEWPQERSHHAVTHLSGSAFVIVGGMSQSYRTMKDMWLCDTTTKLWKKLPLPDKYFVARRQHSVSTLQLGPHCVWLILFGGWQYRANTVIIELIQGGDGEWSVGRVLKRDALSNNTVYQDMLREGRRKGLPVMGVADRRTVEEEQEIRQLREQVQQLQVDRRLTQQHQLEAGETPQQVIRQLTHEQEAANRRTREMEEEIRDLQQQIRQVQEEKGHMEEEIHGLQHQVRHIQEEKTHIEEEFQGLQHQVRHVQKEKAHIEEEFHQQVRQLEEESQLLQQQLDQSLEMSQQAIQAANRRAEEAQQRIREIENDLHRQVYQLQEQLAEEEQPHWVVSREEVEMTTEELGRGGWGVVIVAKFRGLRVAAKCLHQVIISRHNIRQFTREMSIAAKLRHPNLVLFIGATKEEELVILTELMPTSLRKELDKRVLSREQVISICRDVCRGLSYMHQWRPHPIIHRDISSGNVLLEPLSNGWRAKISDYGSANFTNLATTQNPGCVSYAAPESHSPDHHSPKMDIFSFGVLLVEMSLSEFPESTTANRAAQIRRIHWPAMVSLIKRCIRERPGDRPNTSDIMSVLDMM